MRKLVVVLALVLVANPALAQVTIPYGNYVNGQVADASQIVADFAALSNGALNRTTGILLGTLTSRSIVPVTHNLYDLGTTAARFKDGWFQGNLVVSGTITGASGSGVGLLGAANTWTALNTFSAGIAGTTGVFSGAVSGTTGTFSGAVAGTTGTFSGVVTAAGFSGPGTALTGVALLGAGNTFTAIQGLTAGAYLPVTQALSFNAGGTVNLTSPSADVLSLKTTSVVRWGINPAGDWTVGASGNIADSSGTPTMAAGPGSGASPSVIGTDYAMIVTPGTGSKSAAYVLFGHTWTTAPVCVASGDSILLLPQVTSASTTTLTLEFTSNTNDTQRLTVLCRSY